MADKKIKPEALKGRSGGVVTAIMVVWLLALTGLVFMFMKASKESGLEDRITKLETKAATVVGKVRPADDTRDGAIEARVNALEKRLSEGQIMAAAGTTGGQTPAGVHPCNCEEMMGRLSRMESMILAKGDLVKELKKDASLAPAATEPKTDEKKPVKPRTAKKTPGRKAPNRAPEPSSAKNPENPLRATSAGTPPAIRIMTPGTGAKPYSTSPSGSTRITPGRNRRPAMWTDWRRARPSIRVPAFITRAPAPISETDPKSAGSEKGVKKMVRAGVIGATGYAGAELVRILSGHPEVTLSLLTSRQYAGDRFDRIYPAMAGHVPHVLETFSPDRACDAADILFISLPHKLPMEIVPRLIAAGKRVVDLSADFRFKDVAAYEAHYQPHTAPDLLEKAVYGLPEIYADEIRRGDLIGNPGCYPTSVLLPVIPLLKAGLIDPDTLIADAKSGVSGAGRTAAVTSLYCEVAESFKAYKVTAHRHNPEMNEILSRQADRPVRITFVPHLVPMSRGMETTIYATLTRKAGRDEILACLETFYRGRPFIRILPKGRVPDTLHVRGTNYCDIGVAVDEPSRRVILLSAIDNLVKGAAGQAVQNMNLMLGISETLGLSSVPYPL